MTINTNPKEIEELLTRGVEEIIEKDSLIKKLKSGVKLRIKHGIDPTSPIIHLGNAVVLWELRQFQELGHQIILIIGDFTAQIGDPSDKEAMRRPLTKKEVEKNTRTYKLQIGKILDLKKTKFLYNSQWLSKINFKEIVLKLASQFTIAQILERENFAKRYQTQKPIGLHEFLYPLMQGYDSVVIKADIEIGGTDQKFNMLAGRDIQRAYGQKPQDIITIKLLPGTDGRKMSKSYGNIVGIMDEPNDMYGKIMSIRDELIPQYFELCLPLLSLDKIKQIEKNLKNKKINPRDAKARLAYEIVSLYHGKKSAQEAEKEFNKIFKEKALPSEIPTIPIKEKKLNILDLLVKTKLASSKSEAKRLILQRGVKIKPPPKFGGEQAKTPVAIPSGCYGAGKNNWKEEIKIEKGMIIQVGKRKFVKIK